MISSQLLNKFTVSSTSKSSFSGIAQAGSCPRNSCFWQEENVKTTTKWILGIAIGLIALVAIVSLGYLIFNHWGEPVWAIRAPGIHPREGWRDMPMRPYRVMPPQRIIRYFPLRFLGGGLIYLGLLALIILGIIALIRGLGRPQTSALAAQTGSAAVVTQATSQICPNCKRPVQEDWQHCPYCGTDLPQA